MLSAASRSNEPISESDKVGTHLVVPSDVLATELDGGVVLLKLDTGAYFRLNEVGARMWEMLGNGRSVEAAYQAMMSEYQAEPGRLRLDLVNLTQALLEQGLLETVAK